MNVLDPQTVFRFNCIICGITSFLGPERADENLLVLLSPGA